MVEDARRAAADAAREARRAAADAQAEAVKATLLRVFGNAKELAAAAAGAAAQQPVLAGAADMAKEMFVEPWREMGKVCPCYTAE